MVSVKNMNKKNIAARFITWCFLFTTLSTSCSVFAQKQAASTSLDKVVAIVNDDVLTENELLAKFEIIKQQLANNQTATPNDQELRAQVLNHLIDQKIELQTAARAGIDVEDDTVNKSIEDIAKRNNLTLSAFKQYLTENDFDFNAFHDEIHDQIIIERLLQREIGSRITVTKQEIDKYLNSVAYEQANISEYQLQDILIALPDIPSTEQVRHADLKVNDILQKLQQGKSFEELAIAKSDGGEALQGGSLGWRRIEEIPTIFAEKVQIMEKGEVVGPIRAPNGYHILKLVDIRGTAGQHFTTEFNVKHILLRRDPVTADAVLKANIEKIRAQIENGLPFDEAAKKYSQDPISAAKGGALGWMTGEELVPAFTKAMNEVNVKTLSQPVRTEYGWHIIFVEERRQKEDTKEFQRKKIQKMVFERKYQEESQAWVKKMRDASYVEIVNSGGNERRNS